MFPLLRLQNLFSGLANLNPNDALQGQQGFMPSAPPIQPEYDAGARMNQLYQPEHQIQDMFTGLLNQYPTGDHPSNLRKIGSVLAGLGAEDPMAASYRFAHGPYLQQVQDWQTRIKPTMEGANLERQSNVNNRMLAEQTVSREQNQQKIDETERRNRAVEADKEVQRKIQQQRADVYEFSRLNPNLKFDFSGPTVLAADPATGQVTDTKIPTGALSDADKLTIQNQNRLQQISAQGAESRATKGTASGTPRLQMIQPLDENGKPNGPPVRVNLDTMEVTPVPIKGFTKAPPRAATGSTTVTEGPQGTTVRKVTPGVAPMTRTVRNKKTGEVKQQTSTDGGITWKFQ